MPEEEYISESKNRRTFMAILLLLLTSATLFAQKGVYDIRIDLSRIGSKSLPSGSVVYMGKYIFDSKNSMRVIDSARVDKKGVARFKGYTYPLNLDREQKDIFTAGQYIIYQRNNTTNDVLFSTDFFYSDSEGKNFKEKVKYHGEGVWSRIKPWSDKYGPENELAFEIQRLSRQGTTDFKHLNKRALKATPNSLTGTLLRFLTNPDYTSDKLADLADERLYYTNFGLVELYRFLSGFSTSSENARNTAIDYLLKNEFLTHQKLKAAFAMHCFRYFSSTPVMGCEGSAVYVAEKYILGNEAISSSDMAEIAYYVTLNKGTLIGSKAPTLNLKDTSENLRSIEEMMGEYSVIYFYSDDCLHCKTETPLFVDFLNNYRHSPLNVFTVYTGTNKLAWQAYIEKQFNTVNPFINWIHTADLNRESNFPVDYGIISTPKMLLLDNGLRIIGRGILTSTLSSILENENEKIKKQFQYLSVIFPDEASFSDSTEIITRKAAIDKIYESAGSDIKYRNNLLRQTYLYLFSSDFYPNQEAAAYVGSKYICPNSQTFDDTVFVSNVCRAVAAFNKNKLNTQAADLQLSDIAGNPADLLYPADKYKVLIFYKTTCGVCSTISADLVRLWKKYREKIAFTGIYVGQDLQAWRKFVLENKMEFRQLYDKENLAGLQVAYDVETVPHIYLISPDNIVEAKDIGIADLEKLLEILTIQ